MRNSYQTFSQLEKTSSAMKLFLFFLMVVLTSLYPAKSVQAQTLITDISVPALTPCGDAQEFTVKIKKGTVACNSGVLHIKMPNHFEYVPSTLKVDGVLHAVEATSTIQDVDVKLPPISKEGQGSAEMVITFKVQAKCEAMSVTSPVIEYEFSGCGPTSQLKDSEAINITPALMRIESVTYAGNVSSGVLGSQITRTIKLKNAGTGTMQGVTFVSALGTGLTRVSLTAAGGVTIAETAPGSGIYSIPNHVFAQGTELNLTEVVQITSCVNDDLKTNYEVYYGCNGKCTVGTANGTRTSDITINTGIRPVLAITHLTSANKITCLNATYIERVKIRNTGSGTSNPGTFILKGDNAASKANVSIKSNNVKMTKAGVETVLSTTTVNHAAGNIYGLAGQPNSVSVNIPELAPNEEIIIEYETYHAGPVAGADCSKLESSYELSKLSYEVTYSHKNTCVPAALTGDGTLRDPVSYSVAGYNVSDLDMPGAQPYEGMYFFSGINFSAEGMDATNGYYAVDVEFSENLAASITLADLQMVQGSTVLAPTITKISPTKFRFSFKYGTPQWPTGQNLNLTSVQLKFKAQLDCTDGLPAFYKVSSELARGGTCTNNTIYFKCDRTDFNEICPSAGGSCTDGGVSNHDSEVYRVTYGDQPATPGTPIVTPTSGMFTDAFTTHDIIEFKQKGDITVTLTTPDNGWKKIRFIIKPDTQNGSSANQYSIVPNSGKIEIYHASTGSTYTITNIPVTLVSGEFRVDVNFESLGAAVSSLPANFKLGDNDVVTAYLRLRAKDQEASQTRLFIPTEIAVLDASSVPYICSTGFSATALYISSAADFVKSASSQNITDCETKVLGAEFTSTVASLNRDDVVFTEEHVMISKPQSVVINVPNSLTLRGYELELIGQSVSPKVYLNTGITPVTNAGFTVNLNDPAIRAALGDNNHWDEGFILKVKPILSANCNDLNSASVSFTGKYSRRTEVVGAVGYEEVTSPAISVTYNFDNSKLTLGTTASSHVAANTTATWIVRLRNQSGFRNFTHSWIKQAAGSLATVTSIVPTNASGVPTGAPALTKNSDYFYVGSTVHGYDQYFLVTADLPFDCDAGSVVLEIGNQCATAFDPSTVCARGSTLTLNYTRGAANLQMLMKVTPLASARPMLCESLEFNLEVQNNGTGDAKELFIRVPLNGVSALKFVDGTLEISNLFNSGSNPTTYSPLAGSVTEVVGGELLIRLDPAFELPIGKAIRVKFALTYNDCDFVSGQRVTFHAEAKNICGSDADAQIPVNSERITLGNAEGFEEPALEKASPSKIEMAFSSVSEPGKVKGLYSYTLKVNGARPAAKEVMHFSVQLPTGWAFDDPATSIDPTKVEFVALDPIRGYVFRLIDDIPVGGSFGIVEAPITYTGDVTTLTCSEDFGASVERVYALLTPLKAPGCTAGCTEFEHEIFITGSPFVMSAPPAPTGNAAQTLCEIGSTGAATLADIVLNNAHNVQWFSANNLTTPLPLSTVLVNGVTYYARNRWSSSLDCYSTTAVAVKVELVNCYFTITGKVFNDVTGNSDGLNGDGTNISGALFANLIDASGKVVETVPVSPDGTYTLTKAIQNQAGYVVQITINEGVVGDNAPVVALPDEWVNTGDYPGFVNDGTVNGSINIPTTSVDVVDVNFGVQHRPTPVGTTATSQINPGGTNTVDVPASIFGGTDPHGGIITHLKLTVFPSNTTTLIIDGVSYTNISDIQTAYPNGIPTSANGQPTIPMKVDPVDGSVNVEFTFKVVDNAGFESTNTAKGIMPFVARDPIIELVKTASTPATRPVAGEQITYTFKIKNAGNVPLTGVVLTEDTFSGAGVKPLTVTFVSADQGSAAGTLLVDEEATYQAVYTMVQADVDAGKLTNEATATGYDNFQPGVSTPTKVEDDDDAVVKLIHDPSLDLVKTGDYKGDVKRAEVGDAIEYEFVLTNTGNVTLSNIAVDDRNLFTGTGTPIVLSAPIISAGSTATALAPNGTMTYTATYLITQADIDAGEVKNQALATAKSPNTDDDPTGIPVEDLSDDPNDPTNTDPNGDGNPDDPTVIPLPQMPLVELTKEGVYTGAKDAAYPDDEIRYRFVVTNTGNVTLGNVTVNEHSFSGHGNPVSIVFSHASLGSSVSALAPAGKLTYTATYKIVDRDIYDGKVINQAIVSAYPPGKNVPITDLSDDPNNNEDIDYEGDGEPDDPTIVLLPVKPSLAITKIGTFNDDGKLKGQAEVGETISYQFVVTNTGNVDLENVQVVETYFTGTGSKPVITFVRGTTGSTPFTLKREGALTYEATYVVTQADINAGKVINQAQVIAHSPFGGDPIKDLSDDPTDPTDADLDGNGDPDDPTVVILPSTSSINLLKDSKFNDESKDGYSQPGETITFTFTITNTGLTTLKDIVIHDSMITGEIRLPKTTLEPGESMQATASYIVKQSDIDRGGVYNIATVTGKDPGDKTVTDKSNDPTPLDPNDPNHPGVDPSCPDCTITPLPQNPGIKVEKNSLRESYQNIGEKITFVIKVTNTGNVTLTDILVTDIIIPDWSEVIPSLSPGQSKEVRVEYTITQADIDRGHVLNVANAIGKDPNGNRPKGEDDVKVPFVAKPGIEIVKTADLAFIKQVGEIITYTLVVKNTGNVDLINVLVKDPLTGFAQTIDKLKIGESRSFETKYTVKASDIQNKKVVNIATVEGTTPEGGKVTDEDDEEVPVRPGEDSEFKIPNVFTPNGDGSNDTFEIIGLHGFDRVEILIFNRWGNEVYRSRNYQNNWAGLNLNEGTYYYIIHTHKGGVKNEYKGWVLLKRN